MTLRNLARIAGIVLTLAASAFFVAFAWRSLHAQALGPLLHRPLLDAMAMAALAFACVTPLNAWAWSWLLGGMRVALAWPRAMAIMGITQMGKYLPGNIGQHLGRVAMSLDAGLPKAPLAASLVIEILLAIAAAAATAIAALALSPAGLAAIGAGQRHVLAVAALLVVGALILGSLFVRVLPRWLRKSQVIPGALPGAATLTGAFALYVLTLLLSGAALYAIARTAAPAIDDGVAFATGTFALAWVAGFVAPGAPAGLGVREGVMALLLAPAHGDAAALEIIVALRIATTAGDLLAFLAGLVLQGGRRGVPHA